MIAKRTTIHPGTVFTLLQALQLAGFSAWVTSYTPFMLSLGLSIEQIELANVAFVLAIVLSEVPTGALADGRGRGFSMRAGYLICALGIVFYAFCTGFWSALLAEIFVGVGFAFLSGANVAWLADALNKRGEGDKLRSLLARSGWISAAGAIVMGAVGAFVAEHAGLRTPWFVGLLFMSLSVYVAFKHVSAEGEPEERINEREALKLSLKLLRRKAALRWICGVSLVMGLFQVLNQLWTPYFLDYMPQAHLGWIWVMIQGGFVVAGRVLERAHVSKRLEPVLAILIPLMSGTGLILLSQVFTLPLSILALLVHESGRMIQRPITEAFIHHRTESAYRATFGSVHSMIAWAGRGAGLMLAVVLAIGQPDTTETIRLIWFVAGMLTVAGAMTLWIVRPKPM